MGVNQHAEKFAQAYLWWVYIEEIQEKRSEFFGTGGWKN